MAEYVDVCIDCLPLRKQCFLDGGPWVHHNIFNDKMLIIPHYNSCKVLESCSTFFQAGAEAGVSNPQFKNIKHVFRIMAILMIPLTAKFATVRF